MELNDLYVEALLHKNLDNSCSINFLFISCVKQHGNKTCKGKFIRRTREVDRNTIVIWDCNSLLSKFTQQQPPDIVWGITRQTKGFCKPESSVTVLVIFMMLSNIYGNHYIFLKVIKKFSINFNKVEILQSIFMNPI